MNTANFPPNTVIIIPTLSNTEGLQGVLNDIQAMYGSSAPVIVVNNSANTLNVKADVINQGKNTGFARAVNDGARLAISKYKATYLVFLNDDVSFKNDWVDQCFDCIKTNGWSAAAPILITDGAAENYGYNVLKTGKVALNMNESNTQIDGITAAALVMTAAAFNTLNGFDEKFFAYLEDVDLFLRMKKNNLTFGLCTDAHVYHKGHKTSARMPVRKAWWDLRNWIIVIAKNWTWDDFKQNFWGILLERLRNISGLIKALF